MQRAASDSMSARDPESGFVSRIWPANKTGNSAGAADRLIVHHAIWRSVGVMVGLVAAAAMGIWSVRGSPARRPAAGSLARHRRHRSNGPGRQPVVRRGTRRLDGSRRGRRDHLPVGRSHDQPRRPVCSARHGHLVPGSGRGRRRGAGRAHPGRSGATGLGAGCTGRGRSAVRPFSRSRGTGEQARERRGGPSRSPKSCRGSTLDVAG